ncbi:DUF957 domain-containing protein [Escherichia coli]|nr:DUF957 domain-containing protein [Escherichia coli]EFI1471956.1 DUF957 domain-containing protein [Escherichia coli]EFN8054857.1 DUF957 domain-containing protein [Escherichia coli]EJG7171977.1 DUF957 domain-containing protein [Escherichia coli]EJG7362600.1 DUF957 domain-containing protein [Escherichia coli]
MRHPVFFRSVTTETALLSCIKQAREDVLTLRHLQLLHQNR